MWFTEFVSRAPFLSIVSTSPSSKSITQFVSGAVVCEMTDNVVNYTVRNELLGHAGQRGSSFLDFKASHRAGAPRSVVSRRPAGLFRPAASVQQSIFNSPCLTSKLPCILREHEFDLTGSNLNKIFCSQWLDDRFAIMGSKCNKVSALCSLA